MASRTRPLIFHVGSKVACAMIGQYGRRRLLRQPLEPSTRPVLIGRRQLLEPFIEQVLTRRRWPLVNTMPRNTVYTRFGKYHCCFKARVNIAKKARYVLASPKPTLREVYLRDMHVHLMCDRSQLRQAFMNIHKGMPQIRSRTACRIAARRLLNKALQIRQMQAGSLLRSIRYIQSIPIKQREDFGTSCHSRTTEPYFSDSAYCPVKRVSPIPINEDGACVLANDLDPHGKKKRWECTSECKPLTDVEVDAILSLKESFNGPVEEVRHALDVCDEGCPNGHYTKLISACPVALKGHPLVCSQLDGGCQSKLRILRAASTHFPLLRNFLHDVHSAISSHICVTEIDKVLCTGNFRKLMELTHMTMFAQLLSNDLESCYQQCTDLACDDSALSHPNLELQLEITHAALISELEKEIEDFPDHACCSCACLLQRRSVSVVKLSDDLKSDVWARLKSYMLDKNPKASNQPLCLCRYCKPNGLNGLHTVPIPSELTLLDSLSRQLIQRAKCYQTIVRLGTYTGNVPSYNSLKACKGTMFFLPLPLNKTLETLDQVGQSGDTPPDPELYIIVNGKPTKSKVVWRSLVNVNHVKAAVNTLRMCNWLYKDVTDKCIDEATKHIIEVSNSATSGMLEKASKDDVASFQAYTIRNLDNK